MVIIIVLMFLIVLTVIIVTIVIMVILVFMFVNVFLLSLSVLYCYYCSKYSYHFNRDSMEILRGMVFYHQQHGD